MKKIFTVLFSVSLLMGSNAQNIGIGVPTPAYPLTVAPNNNGVGIVQKNNGVEMGLVTNATGGWLKTLSNHNLNFTVFHVGNNPDPVITISTSGNVGISTGLTAPAYKLDINGRMRIWHNSVSNQTAGIWMDGNTLSTRSLIGTINENHVGIWGNGGTGWNFSMNVNNGNTGFGTSAPAARLHVNGNLRLRSNSPKTGSKLVSADDDGNVTWQAPVAFRAWGSPDGEPTVYHIQPGALGGYLKYHFSSSTDYNLGFHYNANTSEFVAPVDGIYHFNAQIGFELENAYYGASIEVRDPSGYPVTNSKYNQTENGSPYPAWEFDIFDRVVAANVAKIETELRLSAGERVYVKIYRSNSFPNTVYDRVNPDIKVTWFAGHLVSRL